MKLSKKKCVVLLALFLTVGVIGDRLVWPVTGSVEPRLLIATFGVPAKGDYINIEMSHPMLATHEIGVMTKRVGCMPGETLSRQGEEFFCQGEPVGKLLTHTTDGRPLTPFAWQGGEIPPGKVYLVGDHLRSFDSRYFGLVDQKDLQKLWAVL